MIYVFIHFNYCLDENVAPRILPKPLLRNATGRCLKCKTPETPKLFPEFIILMVLYGY